MKWLQSRMIWGLLLIAGGVIFLLQNLGIFEGSAIFWAVLFGVAGVAFLSVFFTNRTQWWGLIPGMVLLGIASIILLDYLFPNRTFDWGGVLILGAIGLAFLLVFLADRSNWWAIIPAGVMGTLAGVVFVEETVGNELETGGIFFLGLGLTFAIVALLPTQHGKMRWAWIPAGILGLMGLLLTASAIEAFEYIWPVIIIGFGLFLILRTFRSRSG